MKQAMMQRYLDFMANEIFCLQETYKYTWDYLMRNKVFLSDSAQMSFIKGCNKGKYRENNMSYIQTKVKRAIAGTGEITQAVAQGMEKQIAILIKDTFQDKLSLSDNKYAYGKDHYISLRDKLKSRLARLVELQQAIRKEKQKGKYE